MLLPRLVPEATPSVPIQETAFSHDLLGRFICNSWDELVGNGGDPFDVVVIGAGMYGGYIADKLYRDGEGVGLRVLVLDAGALLASTHLQNLPRVGVGVPDANTGPVTNNTRDPGTQSIVWGFPWHSNQTFPGLAYCLGGRSIFWGGWAPQMMPADLAQWPPAVVQYLNANYAEVETEIGVTPKTDYISGKLFDTLLPAFKTAAGPGYVVDAAPLAVQGKADDSGLFAFDKYSSAYLLADAVREDIGKRWRNDINAWRRLMLLPRAHVTRLQTSGGVVTGIELRVNGAPKFLGPPLLSTNCRLVLAASTIESTRLALESFPAPRIGANLMAHLRSNVTVRIKRSVFPALPATPQDLETAALIVRGTTVNDHRFHIQVTAAALQSANPEQNMWSAVPDIDLLHQIRANQDPNWIVLTLRCIGELKGHPDAQPGDVGKSWINLTNGADPLQLDEYQMRRAWVQLDPAAEDGVAWTDMETQALALAVKLAQGTSNLEYWDGAQWRPGTNPPVPPLPPNRGRDPIGSTHHESGTLWMGSPGASVTDLDGKFHHVTNAYVAGPALFPTAGSANPSLTGMTLGRRTAQAIVTSLTPAPSTSFKPIFTGTLAGWQMAGSGGVLPIFGSILETQGGLGLLWYTREVFRNFVLTLDWLSFNPTTNVPGDRADNSGVLIRFPALHASDPANDWKLASDKGYEIQIDDMGFNPDTKQNLDPLHQTGAVYALAPSSKVASKPAGQWNTFEIEATGTTIKVTLNGQLVTTYPVPVNDGRGREGHIGLQNHTGKVQFRNIQIRALP